MWKIKKFSLQSGLELMTTMHDRPSPYQVNHRGWLSAKSLNPYLNYRGFMNDGKQKIHIEINGRRKMLGKKVEYPQQSETLSHFYGSDWSLADHPNFFKVFQLWNIDVLGKDVPGKGY